MRLNYKIHTKVHFCYTIHEISWILYSCKIGCVSTPLSLFIIYLENLDTVCNHPYHLETLQLVMSFRICCIFLVS